MATAATGQQSANVEINRPVPLNINLAQTHEQSLATNTATNLVQLYKALGGGWEAEYPREEAVAARNGRSG